MLNQLKKIAPLCGALIAGGWYAGIELQQLSGKIDRLTEIATETRLGMKEHSVKLHEHEIRIVMLERKRE
jgi:hypothetical protein